MDQDQFFRILNKIRNGYAHVLRKMPGADHSISQVNFGFPFIFLPYYYAVIFFLSGNYIEFFMKESTKPGAVSILSVSLLSLLVYYFLFKMFFDEGLSHSEIAADDPEKKQDIRIFIKFVCIGFLLMVANFVYFTVIQVLKESR